MFDAAIFGNAQEDDAVDGHLHGIVQLALAEVRVAQGDIARQQIAPALDLGQESVIHFSGAMFACGRLRRNGRRSLSETASREKMAAISSHFSR